MSDLETLVQDAINGVLRADCKGHTGADAVRRREAALCMIILKASDMLCDMDHPQELELVFRKTADDIRSSLLAAAFMTSIHYFCDEEVKE